MKQPNEITVFNVSVGYVFPTDEGMREHQLSTDFIADTHAEAIHTAFAWADNRLDAIVRDMYGEKTAIGSVTVGTHTVGRARSDGYIDGGRGRFFEWKYDWPETREQAEESWKRQNYRTAGKPAGL